MSPHAKDSVASAGEPIVYDDGSNNQSISGFSLGSGINLDKTPSAISSDGTTTSHTTSSDEDSLELECNMPPAPSQGSFLAFRLNYLLVTLVIMLADGLQGTHLYVLYEGYGYSVASLYCLGFLTGAVTTPLTGPLVDKFGRKKAALLYCFLEVGINMLEQYPFLAGLIASRMVGGITTNLLSSVFETWLDTEYRARGFDEEKYEIIMRDSVIVSNTAAIASGYLAHVLAEKLGPVGPFEGAVGCTVIAFAVVMMVWTENYGSVQEAEDGSSKSVQEYLNEAITAFKSDSRVLRVGIIQGLTVGSLQIFIFLWSPTLQNFAKNAPAGSLGLDSHGEPAYGLIFGSFMAAGVVGGLCSPFIRKAVTALLTPLSKGKLETINIEGEGEIRPMAVEFLAAFCYIIGAFLLMVPCLVSTSSASSFSTSLGAFLIFEFTVGVCMPCEGVIRSLYIPSDARATMMTLPRMIVNIAVSVGVVSTTLFSNQAAFGAVACLMATAAVMQLSLISAREWSCLSGRVDRMRRSLSSMSEMKSFRSSSSQGSEMTEAVSDVSERTAEQLKTSKQKNE